VDKSQGVWETNIGNLLAESEMEMVEPVVFQRTGKHLDACMFNQGGIRTIVPQRHAATRTADEVMPLEDEAVVVTVTAEEINELAQYMISKKIPHPLSNITIEIDENEAIQQVKINGKALEENRFYYILTSDYLANGGDEMYFFCKAQERMEMNYKL